MESAARALNLTDVNIAMVQETKFINPQYATKGAVRYKSRTAAPTSVACRDVSLHWRDGEKNLFWVENDRVRGPNVITFELVVGEGTDGLGMGERYYIVGCYIPLSDTYGMMLRYIKHVMEGVPKGAMHLVIGNLNVDLYSP